MPEIGDQLRETRMRNRIDITEVEAATKIRAKYLRALENEEWDLLPGPTFVKTFLRTYADYLGLDARNLVEEYRARYERPRGAGADPVRHEPRRRRARPRRPVLAPVDGGASPACSCCVGALYLLGTWGDDPDEREAAAPAAGARADGGAGGGDGEASSAAQRPPRPRRRCACRSSRPGRSACAWRTPRARR